MKKINDNNLYEKLKGCNDNSLVDIHINNSNELNQIVDDLSNLKNYDFSLCKKGIDIKILNFGNEDLIIKKDLTGKIPDNISSISFPECYLIGYIDGLNYKGKLYFSNIKLNKFRIKSSQIGEIEFSNINKHIDKVSFGVWHNNNIGKLLINGGKNIEEIILNGDGEFKNNINFIKLSFVETSLLELRNNNLDHINIVDCIINHFLFLDKNIIQFTINNSSFHKLISIASSNGKELIIKNTNFRELNMVNLYFDNTIIEKVSSISKEIYSIIRVQYDSIHLLPKSNLVNYYFKKIVNIDKIKITSDNDKLNDSYKLGLSFKKVRFNENDRSSYYLGDLSINKLSFNNCTNLSEFFELNNININIFEINDFNLGKAVLNNINIKKKIFLQSPIFNDCIFNGIDFPNDYKIEESSLSNKQLKDTYRQLKHVMDKNSNHTDANRFFEREMEYHMHYLSEEKVFKKGWWNNLKNNGFSGRTAKLIGEKISLKLGHIISEFGNNWISPIFLILLLSLLVVDIFYLYDNFNNIYNSQLNIFNTVIQTPDISNLLAQIIGYILAIYLIFKFYKIILKVAPIISIVGFGLYIEYYGNYPIIRNFFELLYPFRGLLDYEYLKNLPDFKLFIFILYKLIYAILIWHLVVALKRTTKR